MIQFGVARKYAKDFKNYIDFLKDSSIDTYEIGFAFGVPEKFPIDFTEHARNKIIITGHLPFWINLGNSENNEKNINYLVSGLRMAEQLSTTIVFHLGFYGGKKYECVRDNIIYCIKEALKINPLYSGRLGIETTGKQKAIGTVDEIIDLINLIDNKNIIPVVDWSHVFARSNGTEANSYDSCIEILSKFRNTCKVTLDYFHGGSVLHHAGNEKKHISAKNLQPSMLDVLKALDDMGYDNYTMIIESPDSINDIKWLKEELTKIKKGETVNV